MSDDLSEVEIPPFPTLFWNDYYWEGDVILPAWEGFISLRKLSPWLTNEHGRDGELALNVQSPVDGQVKPPSVEQAATFSHFLEKQLEIRRLVLQAVFDDYPRLRECYGDFVDPKDMPEISSPEGLLELIRPNTVHVMAKAKAGFTRVGISFRCKWDEEHGLGVSTHHGKVVAMGGADEAFSEYFPALDD
jgi:hypothetical protein